MMSDPIADMLTRIRNAQIAHKTEVSVPISKVKLAIAEILSKEGYLLDVKKEEKTNNLLICLKYEHKRPVIQSIDRVSKPGHRVYRSFDKIPKILNGFGVSILSTSKGIMTDKEARKMKIGGEIICSVY
jgi:small subunit ribosomal protein S8